MTRFGRWKRARRAAGRALAAVAVAVATATAASAQDSVIVIRPEEATVDTAPPGGPPAEVVRELLLFYNDTATIRMSGSFALPKTSSLQGKLALFRGTLRIFGRVEGPVVVVNGDLVVAAGGVIDGDVLVVGGRIETRPGARINGTRREFSQTAPVYRSSNGLLVPRDRAKPLGELASARASIQTGPVKTTLSLETGRTYNRVEGLPIVFGPTFTRSETPSLDARLDVRGIFRPAADRTNLRDNLGFLIGTEFRIGRPAVFGIGARGYRVIETIEDQPLSRGESGWSAFLFQRDYRDYFEVRGERVYAYVVPLRGLRIEASLRSDEERSVRAGDPISIFRNSDTWRPNPLIDDGQYQSTRLSLDLDTRNDDRAPASGWLVRGFVEHSSSDDASPVGLPSEVRPPIAPGQYHFSRFGFDARRYARFNPSSRANLRIVGGGWLSGDPLPVQHRLSLGGPDILPGFGFRAQNCAPAGFADQAQTALCDRILAVELEVRTRINLGLPFRINNRDFATLERIIGIQQADLVLFSDAGKGWLAGDGPGRVPSNRIPTFSEWKADVGIGIDAGGLGLYLAKAITDDLPLRVVLRLQRRF